MALPPAGEGTPEAPAPAYGKTIPVGLAEIAARLGVKQQTARQWKLRGLLPAAPWTVSGQDAWPWEVIEAWGIRTGRLPSPAGPQADSPAGPRVPPGRGPATEATLIRMARQQRSVGAISRAAGISGARVRGILAGAGLPPAEGGRPQARHAPPAAVAARYKAGESAGALARDYGVGWDVIAGILDALAVPLRGHGDAARVLHARCSPQERAAWAAAARNGRTRHLPPEPQP